MYISKVFLFYFYYPTAANDCILLIISTTGFHLILYVLKSPGSEWILIVYLFLNQSFGGKEILLSFFQNGKDRKIKF